MRLDVKVVTSIAQQYAVQLTKVLEAAIRKIRKGQGH